MTQDEEYQDKLDRYSMEDLIDIRRNIDREKFPDRYEMVLSAIEVRKTTPALQENSALEGSKLTEETKKKRAIRRRKNTIDLIVYTIIIFTSYGTIKLVSPEVESKQLINGIYEIVYAIGILVYVCLTKWSPNIEERIHIVLLSSVFAIDGIYRIATDESTYWTLALLGMVVLSSIFFGFRIKIKEKVENQIV